MPTLPTIPPERLWTFVPRIAFYRGGVFAVDFEGKMRPLADDEVAIVAWGPDRSDSGILRPLYAVTNPGAILREKAETKKRERELQLGNERGALTEILRQLRDGPDLPTRRERNGTVTIMDPAATFIAKWGNAAWVASRRAELEAEAAAAKKRIAELEAA